ncbi:peptide ABC transporter ATP-binding protein [Devosia riboflavina]|uniref:Peptide ABC transporter ATP-binding protein n=1 Tax=Devosia riboflavina TaxID=46914 RepID=A0A087M3C4_9HYPH|nr:ABC transporter ATP-binding protein [Devosia riboflavina]KFL31377.1 peptide ABC transporter ATP-binding protein [Devosia riboflavina]
MIEQHNLLEVEKLSLGFGGSNGLFRTKPAMVLRDVNFTIGQGEIVGLVGESGSGKSTIGKAVLKLLKAQEGRVRFDGMDISDLSERQMRPLRREMQIIFQDPYSSLDPRQTVRNILSDALDIHHLHMGSSREARLVELLDMVGLRREFLDRYPHEFSGGQRQRIGIARAMSVEPRLIVADEAVSALDVSIQAQVINLIARLREQTGVSVLFISHDLSVVRFISDRIIVLYLGKIMEVGPADLVHHAPLHPYSKALVSAEPRLDQKSSRIRLRGDIPSPLRPPSGCVFRTRCPFALPACAERVPELREVAPGRSKACIRDDIDMETAS